MANHHHHHLIHFIGASTDWRGGCLSVSPSVRLSWLLAASVDNTGLVHDLQFIVYLISRVGVSDQFIWNKIHQNQLYLTCSSKTEDCTDSQRTLLLINTFIAGEVVANQQQQQLWRWSNWDLPRRLKWLMHTSLTRSTNKALHCWPVTEWADPSRSTLPIVVLTIYLIVINHRKHDTLHSLDNLNPQLELIECTATQVTVAKVVDHSPLELTDLHKTYI